MIDVQVLSRPRQVRGICISTSQNSSGVAVVGFFHPGIGIFLFSQSSYPRLASSSASSHWFDLTRLARYERVKSTITFNLVGRFLKRRSNFELMREYGSIMSRLCCENRLTTLQIPVLRPVLTPLCPSISLTDCLASGCPTYSLCTCFRSSLGSVFRRYRPCDEQSIFHAVKECKRHIRRAKQNLRSQSRHLV